MEGLEREFVVFNETINREIINNPAFVTATASGRMRDSVLNSANVTIKPQRFVKKVQNYADFIDVGRGAGGKPPLQAILDWLEYEKYDFKWRPDERKKLRLAFAIRNKIGKDGSSKHTGATPKTDIFNNAIEIALQQLRLSVVDRMKVIATNNLRSEFRTITAR